MPSDHSSVAWDDDSWDLFQSQFQFISGKSVDIDWFVDYLRDSNAAATEVDLDELVRENQKYLNSRKHSLPPPPNESRKAKLRRRRQRASHSSRIRQKSSSSSSASYSEKRPLETQTSVSRTRLLLSSGTRTPPVKVHQVGCAFSKASSDLLVICK